ncbi:hypothetical protein HK101_008261 [Irineochytrium annulatum]|nr:hypothetical protein HK101_008261 [Irineochytrium annulatum]
MLSHARLLVLVLLAWSPSAVSADAGTKFSATSLPPFVAAGASPAPFSAGLVSQPGFTSSLRWTIDQNRLVHAALIVQTSGARDGNYHGIGFGRSMLFSPLVACRVSNGTNGTAGVFLNGLGQTSVYGSVAPQDATYPVTPLSGGIDAAAGAYFCEWHMPLEALAADQAGWIVWAFDNNQVMPATAIVDPRSTKVRMHGATSCGAGTIDWIGGGFSSSYTVQVPMRTHALGMAMVWLVWLPAMVFIARYLRFMRYSIVAHIAGQVLACVAIIAFVVVVILGMCIMFPWNGTFRNKNANYIYLLLVLAFWFCVFGIAELVRYRSVRHRNMKPASSAGSDDGKTFSKYSSVKALERIMGNRMSISSNSSKDGSTGRSVFTWATLNAEVASGRILVVADGRYVFDATLWLHSHPGGSVVLQNVAGTDISYDFFQESGFKTSELLSPDQARLPTAPPAPPEPDVALPALPPVAPPRTCIPPPLPDLLSRFDTAADPLTERDWRAILTSRRINPHSLQAVTRLASYFVGHLVDDSRSSDEFRRYAVTARTHEGSQRQGDVIRLRFALIHPTRRSFAEPAFAFGECVEIEARISGRRVSRYYTPVNGSPAAFEVLVRVVERGVMSRWLESCRVGGVQVKIRGPIGRRFLPPDVGVQTEEAPSMVRRLEEQPREVIFFAGGTGIAPFLQLVTAALMPVNQPLNVVGAYAPAGQGQIRLQVGDKVSVSHHYAGGWGYGTNITTGETGTFPLTLTRPPLTPPIRMTLIASFSSARSIICPDILRCAVLAYPDLIQCFWTLGRPGSSSAPLTAEVATLERGGGAAGFVCSRPLDVALVEEVVEALGGGREESGGRGMSESTLDEGKGPLVVVCGSDGFCDEVDRMIREGGSRIAAEEVVLMGSGAILV